MNTNNYRVNNVGDIYVYIDGYVVDVTNAWPAQYGSHMRAGWICGLACDEPYSQHGHCKEHQPASALQMTMWETQGAAHSMCTRQLKTGAISGHAIAL